MASTAPASHTATTSRTRAAVWLVSSPKAGKRLCTSSTPLRGPSARIWEHSAAFAIGLVARVGKPKGDQDRMVPCTTANHQFAMANITTWTPTRLPEARSQTANTVGELALVGTDDGNCTSSAVEATRQVLQSAPQTIRSAENVY